ncbi:MAG: hypothetical protein HUK26_10025 [Duodenibacillus sp.]|nr:hypothetical protein [Duodenibacillus sp.]
MAGHDLADPAVVRELFAMAGMEMTFRLGRVAARKMTADQAADMDGALARHLARALMGENPEFAPAEGFSGEPCARSLASVHPALYKELCRAAACARARAEGKPEPVIGAPEPENPRERMVIAVRAFMQDVHAALRCAFAAGGATRESAEAAVAEVAGRYALAASAPASRA